MVYNIYMEDKPDGKGITHPCDYFRQPLFSRGRFFGIAFFRLKCANPDCLRFNDVKIYKQFFAVATGVAILVFLFHAPNDIQARKAVNCDTFRFTEHPYQVANDLYHSDPVKYKALDKNHDGRACEIYLN